MLRDGQPSIDGRRVWEVTDETTNDHWSAPVTDTVGAPGQPTTPLVDDAQPDPVPAVVLRQDEPKPGQLSLPWRIITFALWTGVILGFASVWNASVQLGLSTWWLGPRGAPQPRLVQLSPFFVPILMLLATINHVKRLGVIGMFAAVAIAAFAVPDLGEFSSIAGLELALAVVAGLVSAASQSGTYRPAA
jgi:hypothetical protein